MLLLKLTNCYLLLTTKMFIEDEKQIQEYIAGIEIPGEIKLGVESEVIYVKKYIDWGW